MIKGILYDLGDIFFEAHFWREWMYDHFVRINHFSGSFRDFYYLYEEFLTPVYVGKQTYNDAYMSFLEYLNISDRKTFMAASFEKKMYFENVRRLYPEVRETLEVLKNQKIRNIVITDNELIEAEVRKNVIEKYRINHLLDKVVTSCDTGVSKPNPTIFLNALELVSLNAHEVLFVAHDKDEIDGAVSIGLDVIEFNNYLNEETKARIRIRAFGELLNYI